MPIPLVLHGASGIDEKTISEAIRSEIGVINIDTELRIAFANALREYLAKSILAESEAEP